jgi:hypothetical protein
MYLSRTSIIEKTLPAFFFFSSVLLLTLFLAHQQLLFARQRVRVKLSIVFMSFTIK